VYIVGELDDIRLATDESYDTQGKVLKWFRITVDEAGVGRSHAV